MSCELLQTHSFHDNYIHGISCIDENYSCDLILDIDYIQEWHCQNAPFEFLVAPAYLRFKQVEALSITITKTRMTMNSYLGSILETTCRPLPSGKLSYQIELSDGDRIVFEAKLAELEIWGESVLVADQNLTVPKRRRLTQ